MTQVSAVNTRPRPGLRSLAIYFLKLGATGFGGPIALVGLMQRDLTERKRWFDEEEFRRGVAFSQLAPGPLAAQLAMYFGWLTRGAGGAAIVGTAFVLPSFLIVFAFAAFYTRSESAPWLQGAFYGISAAVIAMIAGSSFRLARLSIGRDYLLAQVFAVNLLATLLAQSEVVSVLLLTALIATTIRTNALTTTRGGTFLMATLTTHHSPLTTLISRPGGTDLFLFFAKAGALVFGSGLAILPFLFAAVERYHWITPQQFIDAVAVSLVTPGPVVITVAFMGYIISGPAGAALAALGVFLPVYLATILGAPLFERLITRPEIRSLVAALSAAAAGALAGAAIIIAQRAIVDLNTFAIAVVALLLLRLRTPEPAIVFAAGLTGMALRP